MLNKKQLELVITHLNEGLEAEIMFNIKEHINELKEVIQVFKTELDSINELEAHLKCEKKSHEAMAKELSIIDAENMVDGVGSDKSHYERLVELKESELLGYYIEHFGLED